MRSATYESHLGFVHEFWVQEGEGQVGLDGPGPGRRAGQVQEHAVCRVVVRKLLRELLYEVLGLVHVVEDHVQSYVNFV